VNVGEFSWKLASLGKGAVGALLDAMKYLVVPLSIVFTLASVLERAEGPEVFRTLLQEMQFLVLVFGIVITVLGFFRGAYPKGSYSRLTFGMTVAVLAIVYALSLLLGGRLEDALARERFDLDLDLLFVLYFILAVFTIFMQLGEFVDHRRPWMVETGMSAPAEKEVREQHRWYHDFRVRYGSLYHGIKVSRAALTGYVVLPLIVFILLRAGFSSLNVDEVDDLLSRLDDLAATLILFGLPIAAISFPKGFYPKGSLSRLLPAVAVVVLSIFWIWTLGMEGRFVFDSIDGINLYLDYTGLLLWVVFGTSLWIVYYILEMLVYRREWEEGGFQKELGMKRAKVAKETVVMGAQAPSETTVAEAPVEGTAMADVSAPLEGSNERPVEVADGSAAESPTEASADIGQENRSS